MTEGDAVTAPIVVPPGLARTGAPRDATAARATQAGATVVAAAFRGAGLLGSVVSAGSSGVARQVREEIASRWPSPIPGGDVTAALPVITGKQRPPWLSVIALVACATGMVGLLLPLVELGGVVSFALIDIPYVGVSLLGVFVLFSVLPLLDVLQRRVRWTGWLLVPALLGTLPIGLILFAVPWLPRAMHLLWEAAPHEIVGAGVASATLGGADVALVLIGCAAVIIRAHARLKRRPRP